MSAARYRIFWPWNGCIMGRVSMISGAAGLPRSESFPAQPGKSKREAMCSDARWSCMFGLLILSWRIPYSDPAGSTAERQSRSGNALRVCYCFLALAGRGHREDERR